MTDHAHHFRIDTPSGPTVEGRCKHCGETRTFPSWDAEQTGHDYLRSQYVGRRKPQVARRAG